MSIEIKKAPSHHEIKGVRLRANLSQQDCANFMGVTHRTWQRWERGDSPMPNYGWEYIGTKLSELNQRTTRQS